MIRVILETLAIAAFVLLCATATLTNKAIDYVDSHTARQSDTR